jgi:hypothetical protein
MWNGKMANKKRLQVDKILKYLEELLDVISLGLEGFPKAWNFFSWSLESFHIAEKFYMKLVKKYSKLHFNL